MRRLTTAAAVWSVAAVGMLGIGELLIAAFVTGMVILIFDLNSLPAIGRATLAVGGRRNLTEKEAERVLTGTYFRRVVSFHYSHSRHKQQERRKWASINITNRRMNFHRRRAPLRE